MYLPKTRISLGNPRATPLSCLTFMEKFLNSSVANENFPRRREIKVRKNEMILRKNEMIVRKNFSVPRWRVGGVGGDRRSSAG